MGCKLFDIYIKRLTNICSARGQRVRSTTYLSRIGFRPTVSSRKKTGSLGYRFFIDILGQLLHEGAAAARADAHALAVQLHSLEIRFLAADSFDVGVADVVGALGFFGAEFTGHAHTGNIAKLRGLEYNYLTKVTLF